MSLERAPDRVGVRLVRPQSIPGVDPPNHEDTLLRLDLALDLPDQPSPVGLDATRFQRAPEGSGQSAARGGNHVVEGRRDIAVRIDAVVLRDR